MKTCRCGSPATTPLVCWDYISGDGWPSDVTLDWYCGSCLPDRDEKWYSYATPADALRKGWITPEHPDWQDTIAAAIRD